MYRFSTAGHGKRATNISSADDGFTAYVNYSDLVKIAQPHALIFRKWMTVDGVGIKDLLPI